MNFIYIINPKLTNFIKIGRWSGSTEVLHARYLTPYGPEFDLILFEVCNRNDCVVLEQTLFTALEKYRLYERS